MYDVPVIDGVAGSDTSLLNWWLYGEIVIDKLLSVMRAETITAFAAGAPPSPGVIRLATRVPSGMSIEITTVQPRVVCSLDEIVLLPSGEFYNTVEARRASSADIADCRARTFDFGPEDVLKLHRIRTGYPEINFEREFSQYLDASYRYLDSQRSRFDTLELLFMKYQPFTRWRTALEKENM